MKPSTFEEWAETVQFSEDFLKHLKTDLGLTDEQIEKEIEHYLKVEYQSYLDSINALRSRFVCTDVVCDGTNNTQEDIENNVLKVDIHGYITSPTHP